VPEEERNVVNFQMNLAANKMINAIVMNKMSSIQRNRIALQYVHYRDKLKQDETWHAAQTSIFGQQSFEQKAREGRRHDLLKVLKMVKNTKDFEKSSVVETTKL
jgi:hypothetical protein